MDVIAEESDPLLGPMIVGYRRRINPNGKRGGRGDKCELLPLNDDDTYPIHIQDIIHMTAQYIVDKPSANTNILADLLRTKIAELTLEAAYKGLKASLLQPKYIFPANCLPRNSTDIDNMTDDNPDKHGFRLAQSAELASIVAMGTWSQDEILPDNISNKLIGSCKFVYTKKYHPDGTFDKYKARLVFRGDRWYDLYNNKTYAGTVMSESVRLLLAIAAAEDLELQSADVSSAFLYGDIPENQFIYMKRPKGLTDIDMPNLVRLRKSLYGLPMASAKFREHSDRTLKNMGFNPTISDPRIYVKFYKDNTKAYISVHVDDFGIAASNNDIIRNILKELQSTYKITINENLDSYLGMLIWRDRPNRIMKVYQPGYIADLIESFNIDINHPPLTPMLDTIRPIASVDNPLLSTQEQTSYQAKVGSALWLTNGTRPDSLFAVNIRSRYTHIPTKYDMHAMDRVLQYLASTPDLGLTFSSTEGVILYATVDSSYGNHEDRKSHSGCTLHIGRNSGSFLTRSKKQTITADSSTVAEFIAAHLATKEIMWARSLLAELGYPQLNPTIFHEDNMSTIAMINNDSNSQKTKHVAIKYNLIREQVQLNNIKLHHLGTKDMISDILTKPLPPTPFLHLRHKLLGMYTHITNIFSLL